MLREPVVVVQPPEVCAREQEVLGALFVELLEMRDRLRSVGGMVPRVFALRRAREVPTLTGPEPNQLLVALAHHDHGRAWVDQVAHQPVDTTPHLSVLGLWIARGPAIRSLLG